MTFLMKTYDEGPFVVAQGAGDVVLASRPPKLLPYDHVSDEGVLLSRPPWRHTGIVGVVDFRNRTSMGRSNAGVPLYLFHPLDPAYPPFVVGSRSKPAENWLCTAEFVSLDGLWPRGALQERLGPVGDGVTERKAILAAARAPGPDRPDLPDAEPPALEGYKDERWDCVFHIDPEGCEDVDDILAYRDEADGSTTWLIGIADVAAWIPEGSYLDLRAFRRGQTLYDNGVVVCPMLPNAVSTRLASLRSDGVRRPVVGLLLREAAGGCRVVEEGLGFYQVSVTQTYTYESVIGTDVGRRVRSLSTALSGVETADSHAWIETLMVTYNARVARLLRAAGQGLLRRLPLSPMNPSVPASLLVEYPELAHIGRQAGEYCAASFVGDVSHAALDLPEYCHASSPLRRYADLVNQRVLHCLLRGGATPAPVSAAYLNHRAAAGRRMERDLWFLSHVPADRISETEGIALETVGARLSVYCPAWKRVVRVPFEGPGPSKGLVRVFVDRACPRMARRTVCSFAAAEAAEAVSI